MVSWRGGVGQEGVKGEITKGNEKLLEIMDMIFILTVATISQVYKYICKNLNYIL